MITLITQSIDTTSTSLPLSKLYNAVVYATLSAENRCHFRCL